MRTNLALGLFALFVLSCSSDKPVGPEQIQEPLQEQEETTIKPVDPQQAREALQEKSIPYSQRGFFAAAAEGDLESVHLFIEAGMDVNAQSIDHGFDTALMHAAGGGHMDVVKYLIEQGAKTHLTNQHCAGDLTGMEIPEGYGCSHQDALMWAAYGGHLDVVKYLAKRVLIQDHTWLLYRNGPNSGIMLAAYQGHLDVVKFLIDEVYYWSSSGKGAMSWAADQGHLDVVKFLFEEGIDPNPRRTLCCRGNGTTPLMFAAKSGHVGVVRFLLDNGADIHIRESITYMDRTGSTWREYGASALNAAIIYGQDEVMPILLDHWVYNFGADGRDDHGMTTLMYAASWGNVESMKFLIANGASVGAVTYVGTTALMFAAMGGRVDAARFLLEIGEDPGIENSLGYTALSLAEERGYEDIANLLREA